LGLRSALGAAEPNWQPWPEAAPAARHAAVAASAISLGRPEAMVGLDRPVPLPPADPARPGIRPPAPAGPPPVPSGPAPVGPGSTVTTTGATTTVPFNPAEGAPTKTTSGTGALPGTPDYNAGAEIGHPLHHPWGEKFKDWCGLGPGSHFSLQSDHAF